MYHAYWQLDARPFEHTAAPPFQFPAESQQGALLKLRYVLENRRGAAVLAGESGLGKTLLVQKLLADLPANFFPRPHIVYPQMPPEQLLTYLADQLTGQTSPLTQGLDQSVRRIQKYFEANAQAGKHAIIAIDEAHLIGNAPTLEAVRLLMNFQCDGQPLATFLFSGQVNLILAIRRSPPLDERTAVTCILTRFSAGETAQYIRHRLSAAGAKRTIFEASAIDAIHELTHGIPRRINRLCDLALLVGYGEELKTITAAHMESIHQELIGTSAAA
jgi:general secretion pathway protein A